VHEAYAARLEFRHQVEECVPSLESLTVEKERAGTVRGGPSAASSLHSDLFSVQNNWELGNLSLPTSVRSRLLGTLKETVIQLGIH
jgi:hypothetical protein